MESVALYEVNNGRDGSNMQPKHLIKAVSSGDVEEVKRLLEENVDVNERDLFGNTPLMIATINESIEIMNLLLDGGANIDLPRPPVGKTALMLAAEADLCKAAKTLLERGAAVDLRTVLGVTALITASVKGYDRMVELLIDHGADPNSGNNEGTTPLMWAAEKGHLDVTKILLKNGADVDATDTGGLTALSNACFKDRKEIVRLMLDAGASVNHRNGLGGTPLITACLAGYKDIVRILMEAGADVNLKDRFGDTALHAASERGYLEIVDLLLTNGADVHARNENDGTPAETAYENGHFNVLDLLARHGADRAALFLSEEEIVAMGKIRMFVWLEVNNRGGSDEELHRLMFETDCPSKFRRQVRAMVSKYGISLPVPMLNFFKDKEWNIGNGKQLYDAERSARAREQHHSQDFSKESSIGVDLKPGQKTGRNQPCPCGSGRKYKNCCYAKDRDKAQKISGSEEPSTEAGLN